MDRRTFLKRVGAGGIASSLPVAIATGGSIAASLDRLIRMEQ